MRRASSSLPGALSSFKRRPFECILRCTPETATVALGLIASRTRRKRSPHCLTKSSTDLYLPSAWPVFDLKNQSKRQCVQNLSSDF